MENNDFIMIDGIMYDKDGNEVSSARSKSHDVDVSYSEDDESYIIEVTREDGSTWTWHIEGDSLEILDNMKRVGDVADSVDALGANVSALVTSSNDTLSELKKTVNAPNDFYTYSADILTQLVFFISLIFGVLIFIVFSLPFRK